jgi:hypothetical protein
MDQLVDLKADQRGDQRKRGFGRNDIATTVHQDLTEEAVRLVVIERGDRRHLGGIRTASGRVMMVVLLMPELHSWNQKCRRQDDHGQQPSAAVRSVPEERER